MTEIGEKLDRIGAALERITMLLSESNDMQKNKVAVSTDLQKDITKQFAGSLFKKLLGE